MTLLCKIFGHKFIGITGIDEDGMFIRERIAHCVRCGLTKDEIKRLFHEEEKE